MTSAQKRQSLDIASLSFCDSSLKNQSVISLDGFKSPSPLPARQGFPGEQDILFELAESIQIEGTKVRIYTELQV